MQAVTDGYLGRNLVGNLSLRHGCVNTWPFREAAPLIFHIIIGVVHNHGLGATVIIATFLRAAQV